MSKLQIKAMTVRIAVHPNGERTVSLKALCRGPSDLCAVSVIKPRRHIVPPADGLWNMDILPSLKVRGVGESIGRDLYFTGETDWCEGVRLHLDGTIVEHRLAPHEISGLKALQAVEGPRRVSWARPTAALSPWFDPDRPPRIIPAGRPVARRMPRDWSHLYPAGSLAPAAA